MKGSNGNNKTDGNTNTATIKTTSRVCNNDTTIVTTGSTMVAKNGSTTTGTTHGTVGGTTEPTTLSKMLLVIHGVCRGHNNNNIFNHSIAIKAKAILKEESSVNA